jgi:PTH2 family peptidyl-tRNA hydrolase
MEKKVIDPNEVVQYYVVNSELGMSGAKISAQIGHVATLAADYCSKNEDKAIENVRFYREWISKRKIVILQAKEKELLKLIEQGWFFTRDNGLTEVPAGSLTAVSYYPMPRHRMEKVVKRYQTLK